MSPIRFRRSFSRQRVSRTRLVDVVDVARASQAGSRARTDARTSVVSSPSKARFPVNISKSTHPNAHTSLRLSAGRPFACSGDIYAAVPRSVPTPVIWAGVVIVGDAV